MATSTVTDIFIWLAYGVFVLMASMLGTVLAGRSDSSARDKSWTVWFDRVRPKIAPSRDNQVFVFGVGLLLTSIVQVVVRSTVTTSYINDPLPAVARTPSIMLVILAFIAETGMFLLWIFLFAAMHGPGSYSALVTMFATIGIATFVAVALFMHAFIWQGVLTCLCVAWYIYLFIVNIAVIMKESVDYSGVNNPIYAASMDGETAAVEDTA